MAGTPGLSSYPSGPQNADISCANSADISCVNDISNFGQVNIAGASGSLQSRTENVGSGEISHEEEEQGVARDVKIEIDQTVHEEAGASDESRKMESGGERLVLQEQATEGTKEQNTEKPGAARGASDSGFRQSFEVIVVGVIDNFCVVLGFVGGENGLQGAKTGTGPGMFAEDSPSVQAHGGAFAGGYFEGLHGGKALEDLPDAQPGNQHECKEQNHRSGKHVLSTRAAQDQQ